MECAIKRKLSSVKKSKSNNKAAQSKHYKEKLEIWNYSRDSAHQEEEDSREAPKRWDLLKN